MKLIPKFFTLGALSAICFGANAANILISYNDVLYTVNTINPADNNT